MNLRTYTCTFQYRRPITSTKIVLQPINTVLLQIEMLR